MTKEEILSDLQFITDNLDNILKDAETSSPEHKDAFAFGFVAAAMHQLTQETPIRRSAFSHWSNAGHLETEAEAEYRESVKIEEATAIY